MQRIVEPERMDYAPPEDPEAIEARRGLRRVNFWMGNARFLACALARCREPGNLRSLVDLGAGDGALTFSMAQRLRRRYSRVEVILVDRQKLMDQEMSDRFGRIGWKVRCDVREVIAWLGASSIRVDAIIANLFLHHFEGEALSHMLRLIAERTEAFVACDPLRSSASLRACPFLWLLGCNGMVRHDARLSIRAGFRGKELSALWPDPARWRINEGRAGLCSHLFCAWRDSDGCEPK